MNSQELQLACVWVLRGTVSSKAELELLEKRLTLKWADEAGRQLQHPDMVIMLVSHNFSN